MKTQEFTELERETARFLGALVKASDELRHKGSTRAAAALDRLTNRIDCDMSEVLREMRLLEAQGA